MAGIPKQKRFVYTKKFSVNQILRNLQSYKLATGDVHSSQLAQARERYGDDEGKVYGALVLGTTQDVRSGHDQLAPASKGQRKRKRPRKRKGGLKQSKTSETSEYFTVGQQESDEHIEEDISASGEEECTQESKSLLTSSRGSGHDVGCTALSSIVNYSDSESGSDVNEGTSSTHSHSPGGFMVPLSVQRMFEDERNDYSEASTSPVRIGFDESDSSGEEDLGYFQPVVSDSSEDETSGDVMYKPRHGAPVEQRWDEKRVKWMFSPSDLSTYVCWKCNNVGHLPKDCTISVNISATGKPSTSKRIKISSHLQSLYSQCREIKRRKSDHCIECGVHSNLAACLECGTVLCDGRSHLSYHLLNNPSHNTLFSYKLGKLLKCCKPTCEVTSCYELYVCSHCLSKAFSQHYSMVHATWSRAGLKLIPNAICCEEHFEWHRMNCPNTSEEPFITRSELSKGDTKLISEFFF